jgi:hypothetical protein
MAVNLNPDTFTKSTDPLELAWIGHEWVVSHLDAHGLGDAIPFVARPHYPDDWRSAVRGVEVAAHGVARNEIPELCGELERLKTSALLSNDPPEPANGPLYLDADEVARRLGLPSAAKVYDLARRGAIGCSRFGKYVRFSAGDVSRYENESKRRPSSGYLPAVDLGALPPPPVPGSATTRRRAGSGRKPFKPQF